MDTSNYSTNGADYSQHSESLGQIMDLSEDGSGGRKPGEKIYASKDQEDEKKLFVGGLAWDTTNESLKKYFSQYGDVVDCDIKKDPVTRKPRGFGFVLFSTTDVVSKVLAVSDHKVDGKSIDPKPAIALKKPEKKKKIFIGGIGADLKDDEITTYFSKFGTVVETDFPEDKNTKRRLGFAFVTFESSDAAQEAQKSRFHHFGGKQVEVSEAVSREERQQQKMRGGGMGMRGGRGRGGYGPGFRGGYGGYGGFEDQGYYSQGGGYGGGGGGGYGYNQAGSYQGYGGGGYDYNQGGGYGGYSEYGAGSYGGGGYGAGGGGGGGGYSGYAGGYNSGYD